MKLMRKIPGLLKQIVMMPLMLMMGLVEPPMNPIEGALKRTVEVSDQLADDDSFALPDATWGMGWAMLSDGTWAWFTWTTAAVVTLQGASALADVSIADTDGDLCILDGGTNVNIKNRRGAAYDLQVMYMAYK